METIRDAGPNLKSFFYHVCKPKNELDIKGIVLVLHGTEERGGRYEKFGDELAKRGYVMFAIDHIGHGQTAIVVKENLGIWKKKDFQLSVYNVYYLIDKIKKMYPHKPIYILGHDYGGTMAQYIMKKYNECVDGIILSSCGLPTSKDKILLLDSWIKKVLLYDGSKSKGTFKNRTRFLNMAFRPSRTKYDWLNSVNEEVDRFIEDPLCGYVGTIGYYYYQYKYLVMVPSIIRFSKMKKETPVLLIGGKEDIITRKGKMIEKLQQLYEKKEFSNITTILYDRSRHDVLLEWNKEEVAEDICRWMDKNSNISSSEPDEILKNEIEEVEIIDVKPVEKIPVLKEEKPDDLRISTDINR